MTAITRDEWLAEFDRVLHLATPDGQGATVAEIAARVGRSESFVQNRLRPLRHRLIVGRRRNVTTDGKVCWTPTYRLKAEVINGEAEEPYQTC